MIGAELPLPLHIFFTRKGATLIMSDQNYIKYDIKDHIAVVTLDRPPVNAFCETMRVELAEFFESLNKRTDIYCVILRAEGKGFSGGHDLNESKARATDPTMGRRIQETISRATKAVYNCRVPVISAVHGYVVGMGFAFATISDIIVASDDARFMFPEVKVGTVGGPFWFKRVVPDKIARYHFYTGNPISAQDMVKYGAVLKVVPKEELLDCAMGIAKEIAEMYPPSVWASKMVITEGEKEVQDVVDISDRMRHRGNEELLGGDPNKQEMRLALLEHRKPVYDLSYFANK